MTQEKILGDAIIDKNGTNQHTFYVTAFEEIDTKEVRLIKTPTGKNDRAAGAKATKILDLMKKEQRFIIDGFIDSASKTKARALMQTGGTITLEWEAIEYTVNIEKYSRRELAREVQDELTSKLTCVVGQDL